MTVKAKWQIAYKGQTIQGGQEFELDAEHFEQYKTDIIVVTKQVEKTNFKTKMKTK